MPSALEISSSIDRKLCAVGASIGREKICAHKRAQAGHALPKACPRWGWRRRQVPCVGYGMGRWVIERRETRSITNIRRLPSAGLNKNLPTSVASTLSTFS
jgi:hypothetical protein